MKNRKPKFRINTTRGLVDPEAYDPEWATLPNCPQWLRRYKFFTNRARPGVPRQFRLTEASTGRFVTDVKPSRPAAIHAGLAVILKSGRKKFQAAVKASKPSQEK